MALKIETVPCWTVTCDGCESGDNVDYDSHYHHPSEAEARKSAEDIDWRLLPDGRWLCRDCFDHERGLQPCPHAGRCTGSCPDDVCWPGRMERIAPAAPGPDQLEMEG